MVTLNIVQTVKVFFALIFTELVQPAPILQGKASFFQDWTFSTQSP